MRKLRDLFFYEADGTGGALNDNTEEEIIIEDKIDKETVPKKRFLDVYNENKENKKELEKLKLQISKNKIQEDKSINNSNEESNKSVTKDDIDPIIEELKFEREVNKVLRKHIELSEEDLEGIENVKELNIFLKTYEKSNSGLEAKAEELAKKKAKLLMEQEKINLSKEGETTDIETDKFKENLKNIGIL